MPKGLGTSASLPRDPDRPSLLTRVLRHESRSECHAHSGRKMTPDGHIFNEPDAIVSKPSRAHESNLAQRSISATRLMAALAMSIAFLTALATWLAYERNSTVVSRADALLGTHNLLKEVIHEAELRLDQQSDIVFVSANLAARTQLNASDVEKLKAEYAEARTAMAQRIERVVNLGNASFPDSQMTSGLTAAIENHYSDLDVYVSGVFARIIAKNQPGMAADTDNAEALEAIFRTDLNIARDFLDQAVQTAMHEIAVTARIAALTTSLGCLIGFTLLSVAGALIGRRRIVESLANISTALQRLSVGDTTAVIDAGGQRDFMPLEVTFGNFKQRMIQLRDAEIELEKQAFIADQMFDAVVVHDLEGRITACNTAAEKMAGLPRSVLIGLHLTDVIHDQDFHKWTRPRLRQQILSGKIATAELTLPTSSGDTLLCEISATGVRDRLGNTIGFLSIIRDIRERRQQEELLRRQAAVIDQMSEGVFITDLQGKIVYCNPAHEKMVGYAKEDILGKTPTFLTADPNFESRRQEIMAIPRHVPIEVEVRGRRADGTELLTAISGRGLQNARGDYVGRVFLVHDITEMRAKEEQLRQSQKMEAVGQLTGGIAHDFNNLLGILLLNLQLIEGRIGADTVSHNLTARSLRAVDRGARLIQQMLAFSRRQSLSPTSIRLEDLLSEMKDILRRALPANIALSFGTPSGLWNCEADRTQMASSILSLAINARDAMPRGGALTLNCRNETITPEMVRQNAEFMPGEFVCIEITDTGIGIPENQLEHVIEPFFTTKDVGQGTGLGLSMVYGFIKQSRGIFKIKSTVGVATTVLLYLPRLRVPAKSGPDLPDEEKIAAANQARVLLVEDDDDMREATRQNLMLLGYSVITASDGPGALSELAQNPGIKILIADIMLTGPLSGIELAEQARGKWPNLKVLHVSGYSDEILMADGRLKPGVTLLRKPYARHALAEAITKLE
ncbi:MAG: PAS domain-containing sensor histidine kinase [Rhodospirillaceae bacterium]|nr:PAS domain-containing sensor histidine kinase [Rhodospirillaceae bacterium]